MPTRQPRLHLVASSTVQFDKGAGHLFSMVQTQASRVVDAFTTLDSDAAWDLAQYVDLVDAGYGSISMPLYRRAMSCLQGFVASRMHRPLARALFGRSAVMSRLMERQLDAEAQACEAASATAHAA